ncbi:MAG TPA: transporter substrate-binding domain-containing protein [Albitalea sp.]|nr:transporter substrate-binding domain-containing protein [Albitalea sp.]
MGREVRRVAAGLLMALVAFTAAAAPAPAVVPAAASADVPTDAVGDPAAPGAPPLVLTDDERAWLASHARLRVVTKTEWAPIDLYTYEGQFRGLSGDYLALIGQRLGIAFDYRPVSTLAAGLEAIQRGDADIVPSVSRTPQREAFMDFTQPYLDVPNVYVARRGVRGVGPGQSLAGLRVAVEQGYAVAVLIRERHPRAQIVEFADSAAALRGVSEGQADVYLGALPTTSFLVEKLLLTNLEVRGPWHSTLSALHLGVRKGDQMLLGLLDKALASTTLAERQAIHRRWAPLHTLLAEPSPPLALSAAERRLVATLPALRVGYEVDYRPYTLRTPDGHMAGMADDYLRLVADKLGLRIGAAQGGVWSEILARARRGEIDLLVAVAANEEREREFLFIGPWISTPNVLVTPHDAAPVIGFAQYAGRRVAVLRDGQTAYLMRKLHPHVRLVEVARREDLLAAVVNGEADAALVNSTFAAPALAEGLGGALKMAAFFPELNSDLYFAVRRDQPQLASVMRRALASLSDGERAAIASRWAVLPGVRDTGEEARAALQRVLPVFAVVLLALLVSVLWVLRLRRSVRRRRLAGRALAEERDRAERLARMRHDFLTEASHEIRTPVNAVVGALDQLGQQPLPDAARELASLARRAAQTLSEYVNNLLDISKSDAGQLKLVLEPDSLGATLREAADAIAPVARSRGVVVEVVLDPALAAHHVFDAFRLRQVALNLLSNAVKFSAGGAVELHARLVAPGQTVQQVQIDVVDHGAGIPAERLSSLFRPYAQAGDSLVHRSGGTGLGLALCKRLVDAMGGRIAIESRPGRGTCVSVSLSLPVAATTNDPACSAPRDSAPLRVLLADDDRVQQILIEAMLREAGCEVDLADDGLAAQTLWRQHRHPLVLSDLRMPGLDGHALARWVRQQPGGTCVHLVGTSADLDADSALQSGFARLLAKPVLRAAIEDVVREARAALDSGPAEDAA